LFPAREAKKERGRLRCHKRPKSREETPKEGIGGNRVTALQQYRHASNKNQVGMVIFFKFYQSYNTLFLWEYLLHRKLCF
jgi:hypothetical protein